MKAEYLFILGGALALAVLLVFSGALNGASPQGIPEENNAPDSLGPAIMIGACPTMGDEAIALSERIPGAVGIVYPNTATVLDALAKEEIDMAIVGRIAKTGELPAETEGMVLKGGYTLASWSNSLVEYYGLCGIDVHTHHSPDVAEEMLPPCARVTYHPTLQEALDYGMNSAVLISWDECPKEYGLLVPMENGAKVKKFRAVVAYFNPRIGDSLLAALQ